MENKYTVTIEIFARFAIVAFLSWLIDNSNLVFKSIFNIIIGMLFVLWVINPFIKWILREYQNDQENKDGS